MNKTPEPLQKEPKPNLVVKVYLVRFGYQIDFFDGNGKSLGSECKDFGGNYALKKIRDVTIGGFLHVMNNIERVIAKLKKQKEW